jgi:hypothetical protein
VEGLVEEVICRGVSDPKSYAKPLSSYGKRDISILR